MSNTDDLIILDGLNTGFAPLLFEIPLDDADWADNPTEVVSLKAQLYGGSEKYEIPIYSSYIPQGIETGIKPIVSLEEALQAHEFLFLVGDNLLAVKTGVWSVVGDLIIPDGFLIDYSGKYNFTIW